MIKLVTKQRIYYFVNHMALYVATKGFDESEVMQHALVVIDRKNNTVIKCRDNIEEVFDFYLEV